MNCKKNNCNALALKNDLYCYMHSKKISDVERHKARSKGGKRKVITVNSEFEQYALNSISDVMKLNAVLINSVLQNKIDLRIITGIAYNLNLQLKLIEMESIAQRISELEFTIKNNYELSE